ncbi:MAG: (d)CMP kinase [Clostridia bacterium]|nr:(d)CMP kinase [Clostridia bacterium]MBO5298615.1 (d)CMP kinase [Clostridia bacterium]
MKTVNIAIDGPAGAGKSSLAKGLARCLGYTYIDTGALYRSVAYEVLCRNISPNDVEQIKQILPEVKVSFRHVDGVQRVFVNGEDVSEKIRTNEISSAASIVSAIPEVRSFLLDLQRNIAKEQNIVMDGRDIGTVVLPDAAVKIFLTASTQDRAKRRFEEQKDTEHAVSYEEILNSMLERDKNDSERDIAPLKPAADAILLDNSGFQPNETLDSVLKIVGSRINV